MEQINNTVLSIEASDENEGSIAMHGYVALCCIRRKAVANDSHQYKYMRSVELVTLRRSVLATVNITGPLIQGQLYQDPDVRITETGKTKTRMFGKEWNSSQGNVHRPVHTYLG